MRIGFVVVALLIGCGEDAPAVGPAPIDAGQDATGEDTFDVAGSPDADAATEDVVADVPGDAPEVFEGVVDVVETLPDGELPDIADPEADVEDVAQIPEDVEDAADIEDVPEGDEGPAAWRSTLYPEDWTPDFTTGAGDYVPDFSYAGYHRGEVPIPDVAGPVVNVVAEHGADSTGASDATAAVQAAIDAVDDLGGGVVFFPAGDYRFDGVLAVRGSKVVLRGAGPEQTRLRFTRHEGMSYASHITFEGSDATGLEASLVEDGQERGVVLQVDDAGGFAPGDDVVIGQVISEAFVAEHGMTGTWEAFNGTWQPFFRRDVVAVDTTSTPHTITIDVPLRYPMRVAYEASVRRQTGLLSEVGIEHLAVANPVEKAAAWAQDQVHAIELRGVEDSWVRDVRSYDPDGGGYHLQSSGILVRYAKRVTIVDSYMGYAQHRGGGGNGYLFEVRQSSEVLFTECVGEYGRHNFIQNWGFGATGIVWHRITSIASQSILTPELEGLPIPAKSELHHSLAMSCLVDDSVLGDGFIVQNRKGQSTGAGHTGTRVVLWNTRGSGWILSFQYAMGYIIGTLPSVTVTTNLLDFGAAGTEPQDLVEGKGEGATLEPQSLYLDQLARRLSAD